MSPLKKGSWTEEEDQLLVELIQKEQEEDKPPNWTILAKKHGTRNAKQCRERFHQNLKPNLRHGPITPEEAKHIEDAFSRMGSRWADIARELQGRSDNAVKNWWNGSQNRRRRMDKHRQLKANHHSNNQPMAQPSLMNGPLRVEPIQAPPHPATVYQIPLPISHTYSVEAPHHHENGDRIRHVVRPSTASRDHSLEETPSLVSDSTSSPAYSPRAPPSPSLQLPPLNRTGVPTQPAQLAQSQLEKKRPLITPIHVGPISPNLNVLRSPLLFSDPGSASPRRSLLEPRTPLEPTYPRLTISTAIGGSRNNSISSSSTIDSLSATDSLKPFINHYSLPSPGLPQKSPSGSSYHHHLAPRMEMCPPPPQSRYSRPTEALPKSPLNPNAPPSIDTQRKDTRMSLANLL
jgi:Myb-like DNA-binding protein FlbD